MAVAVGGGVFDGRGGTVIVGGGAVVLGTVVHATKKKQAAITNSQLRGKTTSH
jgi:hypothetical protein